MIGMQGSQRELDAMASLLFLVSQPDKCKERLTELLAASKKHKDALDVASKAKGEAEKAVANADRVMTERSAAARAAESDAIRRQQAVDAAQAVLDQSRKEHSERVANDLSALAVAKAKQSAVTAMETAQLARDKDAHQKAVVAHEQAVAEKLRIDAARTQAIAKAERDVAAREAAAKDRETAIAKAEAEMAQRAKKLRELLPG